MSRRLKVYFQFFSLLFSCQIKGRTFVCSLPLPTKRMSRAESRALEATALELLSNVNVTLDHVFSHLLVSPGNCKYVCCVICSISKSQFTCSTGAPCVLTSRVSEEQVAIGIRILWLVAKGPISKLQVTFVFICLCPLMK